VNDVRRIGLFGGTFDPPHLAHLVLAERAREQLALDRVIWMPTGRPPHKRGKTLAPSADRLRMTRLAVRGNRAFTVSTFETRRRGASYTIETLRALANDHPGAELFLVIGEDSLDDFNDWREPESILALATLAVAPRPASLARTPRRSPRPRGRRPRALWIEAPSLDISSSAIRARARTGDSLRYLVPDPVAAYVARRGLYRRTR
jgi:nicotinate-nucleotide adenylyltransferase